MAPERKRSYAKGTLVWAGVALLCAALWYGLVFVAKVMFLLADWYLG